MLAKIKRMPRRKKVLLLVGVAVGVALLVWLYRRRETTTEGGAIYTGDSPTMPVSSGDKAPGQTQLDDVSMRQILGLPDGAPINGEALRAWQSHPDQAALYVDVDGKMGAQSRAVMRMHYWPLSDQREMTRAELEELGALTAAWESGGRYAAMNKNREFLGGFPGHSAEGRRSIGLSYGLIQWAQSPGSLGTLLKRFHQLDPGSFNSVFNICPGSAAELLRMTTAPAGKEEAVYGMEDGGLRNARVRKICGADLWQEPWVSAFKRAAEIPAMQQAQNDLMIESYVLPAVEFGMSVGFCGRAELAVLIDTATHKGRAGMRDQVNAALAQYGGRAPGRAAILDVIAYHRESSAARQEKVRRRRVRMLQRHNPSIGYC